MKLSKLASYLLLLAPICIGVTSCGDDEPDIDKPSGGISTETPTLSVDSKNVSSNGLDFTKDESLELTIKDLGIRLDGEIASLTDLTLSLDGTILESFKSLPATLTLTT